MKPKNEMMKRLHDQRRKAGYIKMSFWCHKDISSYAKKEIEEVLIGYWQNRDLPNNKKSN